MCSQTRTPEYRKKKLDVSLKKYSSVALHAFYAISLKMYVSLCLRNMPYTKYKKVCSLMLSMLKH